MMTQMSVEKLVSCTKEMDERERKKLRAQDLIELVLLLPENDTVNQDMKINALEESVNSLVASVEIICNQSIHNAVEILNLSS